MGKPEGPPPPPPPPGKKPEQAPASNERFEDKPYQAVIYAVDFTQTERLIVDADRLRAGQTVPLDQPRTTTMFWCDFTEIVPADKQQGNLQNPSRPSRWPRSDVPALAKQVAGEYMQRGGDTTLFGIRFAKEDHLQETGIAAGYTGAHQPRPLSAAEREKFIQQFQEAEQEIQRKKTKR